MRRPTASAGNFDGINCLEHLRLVMPAMGALPIPARFPTSRVQEAFDEEGKPTDPTYGKRADGFLGELIWYAEAIRAQRVRAPS